MVLPWLLAWSRRTSKAEAKVGLTLDCPYTRLCSAEVVRALSYHRVWLTPQRVIEVRVAGPGRAAGHTLPHLPGLLLIKVGQRAEALGKVSQ